MTVLSDLRGEGDYSLVDDFYRFMRQGRRRRGRARAVWRGRLRRHHPALPRAAKPRSRSRDEDDRRHDPGDRAGFRSISIRDSLLTFTMDRYVMDVMERIARARGIDFLEMTTSIIPDQVMLSCAAAGRFGCASPPSEELDAAVELALQGRILRPSM